MTENKNGKEDTNNSDEWEFSNLKLSVKPEESEAEVQAKVKSERIAERKKPKLALDESAVPKSKTRSAMAQDLNKAPSKEEDVFHYASFPKRGIAFILDMFFALFIAFLVKLTSPLLRHVVQLFLDRYKLKFIVPEIFVMNTVIVVDALFITFFMIVIPLAFYNTSFGKKLLGLRVRSTQRYTISITQAFKRELIYKPLGIIIIAGFITPFFSKMQQSIHDMLTDTVVIEE